MYGYNKPLQLFVEKHQFSDQNKEINNVIYH